MADLEPAGKEAQGAPALGEDAAIPFAGLPANHQASRKDQHSPGGQEKEGHGRTASGRFRFSFRKKSQKVKREAEDLALKCSFITREQAEQVETELLTEYALSLDQLLEHGGLSAAVAFARLYPRESLGGNATLLVCCGPGNNGGYGLVCARYLKIFGYKLTVFYPKTPAKPAYRALLNQCEKMDIPFLSYMPGDVQVLDHNYSLIVDALFGFTFRAPVRPDLADVLQKLVDTSVPIVSLDVPSGWEVDKPLGGAGPQQPQLRPDTLISLLLPKRCSLDFTGRRHYIAGRLLPPTLAAKLELRLPAWAPHDVAYPLVDGPDGLAASGSASQLADKSDGAAAAAATAAAAAAPAPAQNSAGAAATTAATAGDTKKSEKCGVNCF